MLLQQQLLLRPRLSSQGVAALQIPRSIHTDEHKQGVKVVPRNISMATVRSATALAVLILGHSVPAVLGQTCVDKKQTALCIQDQYTANGGNGNLQCTANDLSDASLKITAIEDGCNVIWKNANTGSASIMVTAELTVTANAAQIFDIGLFIPTAGQGDAFSGECEIYAFECQDDPDDGDSCGDVSQGSTTFNPIEIELPCTAGEEIEFCVAWAVGNGKKPTDECNEPVDATPSNPAKCKCDTIALTI